ncbi:hypothetical protein AQUCO_04000131v1 [Aquilegia coerulea]|uniref:Secreted protein n=1 Tax=Aquilegia coerulea TaxID=218851 RepID=A0A2G5CRA2_AQUCA|nr:hypothetical protein AQUCO_04000131v1 [Aquilegia coerulea]
MMLAIVILVLKLGVTANGCQGGVKTKKRTHRSSRRCAQRWVLLLRRSKLQLVALILPTVKTTLVMNGSHEIAWKFIQVVHYVTILPQGVQRERIWRVQVWDSLLDEEDQV